MFGFSKKVEKKPKFDRKVLRKNDISLLLLDERWNSLFTKDEKTPEIMKCEENVRELMKEEARLNKELQEISPRKRHHMNKIMKLTTEAFDRNNEEARNGMRQCEKEIKRLNERITEIEDRLDEIPDHMKDANLKLLEHTVNLVYFKMLSAHKRRMELERLIEETRAKLKEFIEEKESLSQDDTGTYAYFHDLLGPEELERLDREFFGDDYPGRKKETEDSTSEQDPAPDDSLDQP